MLRMEPVVPAQLDNSDMIWSGVISAADEDTFAILISLGSTIWNEKVHAPCQPCAQKRQMSQAHARPDLSHRPSWHPAGIDCARFNIPFSHVQSSSLPLPISQQIPGMTGSAAPAATGADFWGSHGGMKEVAEEAQQEAS